MARLSPAGRFPALSFRQPWADLVMMGVKDVENRSKRTHFRGTILVHASATRPPQDQIDWFTRAARRAGDLGEREVYEPDLGALLGTVDIVDCVTTSESEWFGGPYGWILSNPKPFRRIIPYKGAVGIFYVPNQVLASTPAARCRPGSSQAG